MAATSTDTTGMIEYYRPFSDTRVRAAILQSLQTGTSAITTSTSSSDNDITTTATTATTATGSAPSHVLEPDAMIGVCAAVERANWRLKGKGSYDTLTAALHKAATNAATGTTTSTITTVAAIDEIDEDTLTIYPQAGTVGNAYAVPLRHSNPLGRPKQLMMMKHGISSLFFFKRDGNTGMNSDKQEGLSHVIRAVCPSILPNRPNAIQVASSETNSSSSGSDIAALAHKELVKTYTNVFKRFLELVTVASSSSSSSTSTTPTTRSLSTPALLGEQSAHDQSSTSFQSFKDILRHAIQMGPPEHAKFVGNNLSALVQYSTNPQ